MSKSKAQEAVSPWEHIHQEHPLLHLEIAPERKVQTKQQENKQIIIQQQKKNVVVHSVHPNHTIVEEKRPRKQSLEVLAKSKYNTSIQQYIAKLEEKAIQDKLKTHPHSDNKKLDIVIKPIAKSDLIINVPLEGLVPNKISIERPIKHMVKATKDSTASTQKHEMKDLRGEMRELDMKYHTRKHSVDNLHKNSKNFEVTLKKSHEYEDQIIKKCALKNIQIYEEDKINAHQKDTKKVQATKRAKPEEKRHILDRILTKFQ